jgi:glycosyltransferase involved in cell wall biosynthesis
MTRVAIIASHPIQYYAPWFARLADHPELEIHVFYLWDFGTSVRKDPDFNLHFRWDIDLLQGYPSSFIKNISPNPGTSGFMGLVNPGLFAALRKFSPDAILFTTLFLLTPLLCLFWASWKKIPCFFRGDSHLLDERSSWRGKIKKHLKTNLFKRLHGALYVGSLNRDYWRSHGIPDGKLFFSPHAVEQDRFARLSPEGERWLSEKKAELGWTGRHYVFLFVGKFETKKDPLLLAEAFRQLHDPDLRLLFVGSGHLETRLEQVLEEDDRIQRLPFQNQSVLPAVYRLGNCLVLPSRGPGETWGLVVNEAQACGLTVICSDQTGCHPDLVAPIDPGFVFRAGDTKDLARALQLASQPHPDPDSPRVQSAIDSLVSTYSYEGATRGLMEALKTLP